jgi:hypothetical protein
MWPMHALLVAPSVVALHKLSISVHHLNEHI